jgi:hypothetical protein
LRKTVLPNPTRRDRRVCGLFIVDFLTRTLSISHENALFGSAIGVK